MLGATGVGRLGFVVPIDRTSLSFGLGTNRLIEDADRGGPFLGADVRVAQRWKLFASGSVFPGETGNPDWMLAGGIRIRAK